MDDFNQYNGIYFERTQPRAWRNTPFEDSRINWRLYLKVVGIAAMWIALLALSLWSISQTVPK